jgi:hypothetical protein
MNALTETPHSDEHTVVEETFKCRFVSRPLSEILPDHEVKMGGATVARAHLEPNGRICIIVKHHHADANSNGNCFRSYSIKEIESGVQATVENVAARYKLYIDPNDNIAHLGKLRRVLTPIEHGLVSEPLGFAESSTYLRALRQRGNQAIAVIATTEGEWFWMLVRDVSVHDCADYARLKPSGPDTMEYRGLVRNPHASPPKRPNYFLPTHTSCVPTRGNNPWSSLRT